MYQENLEKQEDGKFEILDMKLDSRKTKNLDKTDNKKIDIIENDKKVSPASRQRGVTRSPCFSPASDFK